MKRSTIYCLLLSILFLFHVHHLHAQYVVPIAGAGTCGYSGDGGRSIHTALGSNQGLTLDRDGNIYFTSEGFIRKITAATGIITTIAGQGSDTTDNVAATAAAPHFGSGLCINSAGDIYFPYNYKVRKIDHATGLVTTIAGGDTWGNSGDGGPATNALFTQPFDVAVDVSGNVYVADAGANLIRKIDVGTGIITRVAGIGWFGYNGDDIPATDAAIAGPFGVYVDKHDNVYIADAMNGRVRKVDAITGIITSVVYADPASPIMVEGPMRITKDNDENLYFSQGGNILRVDTAGVVSEYAGKGIVPDSHQDTIGNYGPAHEAYMQPMGICFDSCGNLYYASIACHVKVLTPTLPTGDHICKLLNTPDLAASLTANNGPLEMYPNPSADGSFTIVLPAALPEDAQMTVENAVGSVVMRTDISQGGRQTMQLHQPPGMYIVSVAAGTAHWRQKLVIGN